MAYKTQNTFKEPLEIEARVAGWKFIMEGDYSMDQVLYGLREFLKINPVMPVPANIIAILNPPKPRITEAAFIAAQKWQERNDYPIFSDAKDIIEAYHAQEREGRESYENTNEELKSIAGNTFKRIGN
jgi:hypothetical protein